MSLLELLKMNVHPDCASVNLMT